MDGSLADSDAVHSSAATAVLKNRDDVLLAGEHDLASYEIPARGERGEVAAVARPRSLDDLRTLVATAVAHRVRLLVQGSNTGLVGSSVPPVGSDTVLIDLSRCESRIDIDPADRSVIVSAGVKLSELNAAAQEHRLQLPVDMSSDPTIGGLLSTNAGGSRVMRYGPIRAQVRALQMVIADEQASIVGSVHRLAKDSRGTDLSLLALGAGGTLGIVTHAALVLTPLPEHVETWWLALTRDSDPHALLRLLEQRRAEVISAFELLSAAALECTLEANEAAAPLDVVGHDVVLVEWSGRTEALAELERDVAAAFEAGFIVDGVRVPPGTAWGLRHRVSGSLSAFGTVLGHDVSVPRARIAEFRAAVRAAVDRFGPDAALCDFGHIGDGGLHVNVVLPGGSELRSSALHDDVRSTVFDVVERFGGSYSAEHGLGPLNRTRWERSVPPAEADLIAKIKSGVDPRRILGHPDHPYNRL